MVGESVGKQFFAELIHSSFPDALWTAPEHIFSDGFPRSQPGDVFSYGIVLSEILTRALPYNMFEDLSHKGWFLYLCCSSIITCAENHCTALASVIVITLTCLVRQPSSIPQHGANLDFPLHISLLNMVK